MSKDGEWKQVGRNKIKTKAQKQEAMKKMTKVKDLDYSTVQSLMVQYDAKDLSGEPLRDTSNVIKHAEAKPDAKANTKKRNKKAVPENKILYKNIEEALKKDSSSLETKLEQTKIAFPDNIGIWFKEISLHLNVSLNSPEETLGFNGRPFEFPISNAKKSTVNVLKELYCDDISSTAVPHLFKQYVITMLDYIARGIPAWGYRLCIQTLAHNFPELCSEDISYYKEKIQTLHGLPNQALALVWALGQTGVKSTKCGLKVWLELMLPNLHVKQLAQYAMPYIERILKSKKKSDSDLDSLLQVDDFLEIAKWSFGDALSAKGAASTRQRMQNIYPSFLQLILSSDKRHLFKSLLKRSLNENQQLTDELCGICLECLTEEQSCLKVWRDNYTQCLQQSKVLLLYIQSHWLEHHKLWSKGPFKDTIQTFVNTNDVDATRKEGSMSKREFNELKAVCESLCARRPPKQDVKSSPALRAVFFATLLAVIAVIGGVIMADVRTHGGVWKKSDTYLFLKSKGVISVLDYVWSRVQRFVQVASTWLSVNVPYYWAVISDVLGPYFKEIVSYLYSFIATLLEATTHVRSALYEQFKVIIHQVAYVVKIAVHYLLECLDVLFNYVYIGAVWCYENLELVYKALYQFYKSDSRWEDVQIAVSSCYNFIYTWLAHWLSVVGDYIAPDSP